MVNIDADLRNADWIKTLHWEFPTDPEMFLAVIGGRENLDHFMTLPAAEAMPIRLATLLNIGVGKFAQWSGKGEWVEHLHPRNTDGEFTHKPGGGSLDVTAEDDLRAGHAGTREDPVPCGDDIKRAAVLIADGNNVTLNQPEEVATLLDVMQEMVKEAQDKGADAPDFDLCRASVPGTNLFCQDNLGIERIQMPQLSTKNPVPGSLADSMPRDHKGEVNLTQQFAEYLASTGRTPKKTTIDASHLRASQSQLNGVKVAGMADAMAAGKLSTSDESARIYVTEDNYVIDGHHRWAAAVAESYRTGETINIPVTVVPTDIGTALTLANFWTEQAGIPGAAKHAWIEHYKTLLDLAMIEIDGKYQGFDESLHPRDEQGQFTEAGSLPVVGVQKPLAKFPDKPRSLPTYDLDPASVDAAYTVMERAGITHEALCEEIATRIGGPDAPVMEDAYGWYPEAKDISRGFSEDSDGRVDLQHAEAVLAALSPQTPWDRNVEEARDMIEFVRSGKADGKTAEKAGLEFWKTHPSAFLDRRKAKSAMAIAMGGDIGEHLTGLKVRSFYDCIENPNKTREVACDTHMVKAFRAVSPGLVKKPNKGEHMKATGTALGLLNYSRTNADEKYSGAGYIVLSEAVRAVADAWDVPPDVVQAAYWLQVQDTAYDDMQPATDTEQTT